MNLNKHVDFFNPSLVTKAIHVIGCGALGSHVAEQLVRLGVDNIHIWDMDTVDEHNITNQLFLFNQIGKLKTDALEEILKSINPLVRITKHGAYTDQAISGYVFLMVDSIELRKKFVTHWKENNYINAVFDARMRLTDAQAYAADWTVLADQTSLLNTMQFTSEEAQAATPVSACGTTLSVTPTVKTITSLVVSNFINLMLGKELKKIILLDAFSYNVNAF